MGISKHLGGLGFKHIEAFKNVMLAKQLWRLLTNPESLVAQTLKQKYFRNSNLLNAKVGRGSSFLWKSLCQTLDLLEVGLYWRVENGNQIKIYEHKWLLNPSCY